MNDHDDIPGSFDDEIAEVLEANLTPSNGLSQYENSVLTSGRRRLELTLDDIRIVQGDHANCTTAGIDLRIAIHSIKNAISIIDEVLK